MGEHGGKRLAAVAQYLAELKIYSGDRQGLLMDVSKVFTEAKIDVKSMNVRTSKKGTATLEMGFIVRGRGRTESPHRRNCVRSRA